MAPRPTPTDRNARRKARTRSRLVAAARQLFAAQGLEATTISQITERADTAAGSFYNYFRTKDEVLEAVLADTLADQYRGLLRRQHGVEDPAERVSIGHRHLLAAARQDREWGWLMTRLQLPLQVLESVVGDGARADISAGVTSGRFHPVDVEIALYTTGGALLGALHLLLHHHRDQTADVAHAEGVLRSLGVAPADAAWVAARPLPASAPAVPA